MQPEWWGMATDWQQQFKQQGGQQQHAAMPTQALVQQQILTGESDLLLPNLSTTK